MTAVLRPTPAVSLWSLVRRFKWRIGVTMTLVVVESLIGLLFPLFLGLAIDGLLAEDATGVTALGVLGVLALVLGAGRRFYDTRAYSGIYTTIATEMVDRERKRGTSESAIAARANLLVEFIEFLENSMPMVVASLISIVGVLLIIYGIDMGIFFGCLGVLGLLVGTYWATGGLNTRLNRGYNDRLEHQVRAVSMLRIDGVTRHFKALMRWNVRLSDLETLNYSILYLGIIALVVYAPVSLVAGGGVEVGLIMATLMYVLQYIEGLETTPLYIQQVIRLREIAGRLAADPGTNGGAQPSPASSS